MSKSNMQVCIDGKWTPCLPALDFGFIGTRFICDLGTTAGQPSKKLLLRQAQWALRNGPPDSQTVRLETKPIAPTGGVGLRPLVEKRYPQTVVQSDGEQKTGTLKVWQQDVTDLIPLKMAVLLALKKERPERILRLLDQACMALADFGKCFQRGQPVRLQVPSSLAVDSAMIVIPLDAEVSVEVSRDKELQDEFQTYFGDSGRDGQAALASASILHARALRLYFLHLLEGAPDRTGKLAGIIERLRKLNGDFGLDEFGDYIRKTGKDFGIVVDDSNSPRTVPTAKRAGTATLAAPFLQRGPSKAGRMALVFSLLFNLVLAVVVLLMLLIFTKDSPAVVKEATQKKEPLAPPIVKTAATSPMFSSYCVVLQTGGTVRENVASLLTGLFTEVVEVGRSDAQREKLLTATKAKVVGALWEQDKLRELLLRLADKHGIRFKGFSGENQYWLSSLIERGGIFSYASGGKEQHASLLQTTGLDLVLGHASLLNDTSARDSLQSLKLAIIEYASLQDALNIVGDRSAYLIHVEPTAEAHQEVRLKLLSRLEKPIFISRPIPELFDAVDPSADTGGGKAEFALQIDLKCYWRLVGQEDRLGVDFASTIGADRMTWQAFGAKVKIVWRPVALAMKGGRAKVVQTFDIAVVLEKDKVVVFRNQSVFLGESEKQVSDQARKYVEVGLKVSRFDQDAIMVSQSDGQFTGILRYSYLAQSVSPGNDVEVLTQNEFDQKKGVEDRLVK